MQFPPSRPQLTAWRDRFSALRNIPPLLGMVWRTSPPLALAAVCLRLAKSLLPLATLWVSKLIIDHVVNTIGGRQADLRAIWRLVALEFGLAVLNDCLARAITLCDSLLGDRFINRISLRLMQHANRLDLAAFEDPVPRLARRLEPHDLHGRSPCRIGEDLDGPLRGLPRNRVAPAEPALEQAQSDGPEGVV